MFLQYSGVDKNSSKDLLMRKRILVTGASGFIGSKLSVELAKKGHSVIALVRSGSNLVNLNDADIEIAYGDVCDKDSLFRAIDGVDVVFHTAAMVSFWETKGKLENYHKVNVEGSKNVFDVCLKSGVEKVIFTSTLSSIGSYGKNDLTTEEHSFNLWDMSMEYERSKYNAEFEAWRYCARGLPLVAVLPSAPVGPGDIKPTPSGQLLIDYVNRKIPAYIDGGANFVHVDDVVRGHLLAMEKGIVGERYLIGGVNLSLLKLFKTFEKVTGIKRPKFKIPRWLAIGYAKCLELISNHITGTSPVVTVPTTKFSSTHYYIDNEKSRIELGYEPIHSIESAVEEALDWFSENDYLPPKFSEKKSQIKKVVLIGQ